MIIPIGITARNESKNIVALLRSLQKAVDTASLSLPCSYRIVVLLNDNQDNTPQLLTDLANVEILVTSGGIVEAQRAFVARYANDVPFVIFSDADITIASHTLLDITQTMLEHPEVEVAYAAKHPLPPQRRTLLAQALYFYNLREGYQTARHYFNGQFFAIRRWHIPKREELRWDERSNTRFLDLAAGIRADDIYLSRDLLNRFGPNAIRCVDSFIFYRPPETLRGMFRKYQRMRLEIERLHHYNPHTKTVHRRWGQRRTDLKRLSAAPWPEKFYYLVFRTALCLCKLAYIAQKLYFTYCSKDSCPTWLPIPETKERIR